MRLHILFAIALLLMINFKLLPQSGWFQQNSGTNSKLLSCYFINDMVGFACGKDGVILRTIDGGSYWQQVCYNQHYDVLSIYFIENTGWAIMQNKVTKDSLFVLKSDNYGLAWEKYFVDTNYTFWEDADLKFINDIVGYAAFERAFYKTTNGGLNWSVSRGLFCSGLYFVDENTGWIGHSPSNIYKTTNSGANWFDQYIFWPNQYLVDLFFINSNSGFCVSDPFGDGKLFFTSNGGENWIQQDNQFRSSSIGLLDSSTGYSLARYESDYFNNRIAKTSNGGMNWQIYDIGIAHTFWHIWFSSVNTGWVVGDSGTIMKTTTGGVPIGIQQIGTDLPREFSLSQNYPNPFNPVTKIKFDVSGKTVTQTFLSVYDILGREVAVLVDEKLSPGEYEVDFDGSNLPSGVYYYRIAIQSDELSAGDFSETRKMVLIK